MSFNISFSTCVNFLRLTIPDIKLRELANLSLYFSSNVFSFIINSPLNVMFSCVGNFKYGIM